MIIRLAPNFNERVLRIGFALDVHEHGLTVGDLTDRPA